MDSFRNSIPVSVFEKFKYTFACVEILRGIKEERAPFEKLVLSSAIREYLDLFKGRAQDKALQGLANLYVEFKDSEESTCLAAIFNTIDSFSLDQRCPSNKFVQFDFAQIVAYLARTYKCESVYEPFAGKASFAELLPEHTSYLGQEINTYLYELAKLRLKFLNRLDYDVELGDSFRLFLRGEMIVSEVPWGVRGSDGRENITSEFFFLKEAARSASKLSMGIYPYGVLFRTGKNEKEIRYDLVKNDLIDCVIKLPAQLYAPQTRVQACIVITNRNKARKGFVRFIDASTFVVPEKTYTRLDVDKLTQVLKDPEWESQESLWISNEDIIRNNTVLAMEEYLPVEIEQPEGSNLVPLRELLVSISKRKPTDKKNVPLIRVSDLASNPYDFTLGEELPKLQPYNRAYEYVDEPALFISKFRPLKPTFFSAKSGGVYINPNLFAFGIKTEKVLPQYLLNELTKDYVQKQLFYSGTYVLRLTRRTFLDVKILLPSLDEQNIGVVKGVQHEQAVRDNALSAALDVYLQEWGQRQHTLGHAVGALDDILDALSFARETHDGVLHDDDAIDSNGATVKDYFHKLSCAKVRLADLADHLADGIAWEEPDEVELIDFLKRYKKDHVQHHYKMDIKAGKRDAFKVRFSVKRLIDVIENIIHNCEKHGFVDERDDYIIRIELQEATLNGKPAVSILVMNNGRELDPSMNPEKVFKWGESTKGGGLGGSRIKLTVRTYGGTVEFLLADNLPEGFNAAYKIVLPLI